MTDEKLIFYCPDCNYEKAVHVPGKFRCSKCGCKFKIDSNNRMTLVEDCDGEIVEVFRPNKIPLKTRAYHLVISPLLLAYGVVGLIFDDIYIPGKRSRGMHFHGYAAWLVFATFLFAILNMISVIVDHYDKRDNEINYRYFAWMTSLVAIVFFFIAITVQIIQDVE